MNRPRALRFLRRTIVPNSSTNPGQPRRTIVPNCSMSVRPSGRTVEDNSSTVNCSTGGTSMVGRRCGILAAGLATMLAGTLGCATCCSPDLYTYPTFGGRVERVDREYGRVGSIFSDPNAGWSAAPTQPSVEPAPRPAEDSRPAEELELPPPQQNSDSQSLRGLRPPVSSRLRQSESTQTRWR